MSIWRVVVCGLLLTLAALSLSLQVAHAQPVPAAIANGAVDVADLTTRIDVLETRTDLSETERDLVLEQLRAALSRAEAADAARTSASDYAAGLKSAPETIAALTAESAAAPQTEEPPPDADPVALQLHLAALQAESVSLRSKQRSLTEQLRGMESRPSEGRAELADLREQLDHVRVPISANASPLLIEASRLREQVAHEELSARIEKIEQELLSLPTRKSITTAQSDLLQRRIAAVDAAIATWAARIASTRKRQVDEEEARARALERSLAGQPGEIRMFAAETVALRASSTRLGERLEGARAEQLRSSTMLADIEEASESADQILAIGSISDESAQLLRGLQKSLATGERIGQRIDQRNETLVDLRVEQFQTQQSLRTLQSTDMASGPLAGEAVEYSGQQAALMATLVEHRIAALVDLAGAQERLVSMLSESNALDTELLHASEQLHTLLDERLLWLPSTAALGSDWVRQLGVGAVWLATPANWSRVPAALWTSSRTHPVRQILLGLLIVGLFAIRKRLTAALPALAPPVGQRDDDFVNTLLVSGATVLLALAWPLLIGTIGWSLRGRGGGEFVDALGQGVVSLAIMWLMLGLFIDLCRPRGLFVAHFGWDEEGTRRLGRSFRLLLAALAPTAMLTAMTAASGNPELIDGIGRVGFLLGSLALAMFIYRLLRPHKGALGRLLKGTSWVGRAPVRGLRVLVAVPLLLAAQASMGYYDTARELQGRLFTSGWILLLVVIVYHVAMRGVLVASQRAAWRQAEARQAKALAEAKIARAAESGGDSDGSEALVLQNQEAEIDAVTVSQQTRALLLAASGVVLAVMLLSVWREMIPALNVFNDVVLWTHVAGGSDSPEAVTLGNVLMSLLIAGLTAVAARNLPGFLEIVFLQRVRMDIGTRYAITSIARYLILAIGLVIAFNRIGADWSKLQWIVAALGVGLGFGLQEIVANFISGLIILFERPVRVGDIVTIGSISGTVSRIRIRAITLTDFDNIEVVVPNKVFITETVMNWTLSSTVTRVVLKVGIGYGSDVTQAHQLMLDVASANPKVLKSPPPRVVFTGLGDSALEFEVRVHVGAIEERWPTVHELHQALVAALSGANIDIPFPQRDVHVRRVDVGKGADTPEWGPQTG